VQISPIPIFFAENRFRWKNKTLAGNLKNLLENKISSRFSRFPAEKQNFRSKNKSSAGKSKHLLETNFSSWKNKSSAGKIKH
jgi:hypothetical protein